MIECKRQVCDCEETVTCCKAWLSDLTALATERDNYAAELAGQIADNEEQSARYSRLVSERDALRAALLDIVAAQTGSPELLGWAIQRARALVVERGT